MAEEERKDDELRNYMGPVGQLPHRAFAVRNAFFASLWLVVSFSALGAAAAWLTDVTGYCIFPRMITWLQAVGTALLLWGTLFVRGWEIQSFGGSTLTERVNQWIYRALYCVGTAVLIYSLSVAQCAK